jgi:ABC-2 type transport system permease protein
MTTTRQRHTALLVTLLLAAANLVAFNLIVSGCSGARLDLTADSRFSVSPATKRLLASLDDDLWVTGYFSKRTHPKLSPLVPEIADLLQEYRAVSGDRVHVEFVDPGEDETVEQEASQRFGVQSTPFRLASKYESGIVNAYFALVVRYGDQYVRYGFDDLIEVEGLPDGDVDVRLRNLEYDLTRAIKKVVFGFRSTAELFERVGEPVRLTAIMTPEALPEALKSVPEAVRGAASELTKAGGERFEYTEIVPTDDATRSDVATRYGAQPMSLGFFGGGDEFYLYALLQSGERLEQLSLTGDGVSAATVREAVEASLRRQTPGFLKTIGMVTPAPSIPPEVLMQLRMQGQMPPQPPPEFEQVKRFMGQDYTVRDISLEQPLAGDIDILLVLKPRGLSERAVYNLDQYLMRGGRVVICMGSYEPDFSQSGLSVRPVASGLDAWLAHFGVDIEQTLVLDDRNQPLPIPQVRRTVFGDIRTWALAPYPYLVEVRDDGFLQPAITTRLSGVGFYWGSPVRVSADSAKGLERIEILKSSKASWTSDDLSQVATIDYQVPAEGTEPQLLAVALQGEFDSYFAHRPAPATGGEESGQAAAGDVALTRSPATRLTVIGNAEFLSDLVARIVGQQGGFFAQNLAFMQNLIDWMNPDNDLIAIRARSAGASRLERVEKPAQLTLEALNYLIPLGAVLAFGMWKLVRRRRVTPIVAGRARSAGGTAAEAQA